MLDYSNLDGNWHAVMKKTYNETAVSSVPMSSISNSIPFHATKTSFNTLGEIGKSLAER